MRVWASDRIGRMGSHCIRGSRILFWPPGLTVIVFEAMVADLELIAWLDRGFTRSVRCHSRSKSLTMPGTRNSHHRITLGSAAFHRRPYPSLHSRQIQKQPTLSRPSGPRASMKRLAPCHGRSASPMRCKSRYPTALASGYRNIGPPRTPPRSFKLLMRLRGAFRAME